MRAARPLLVAALVSLFLAEGQRAFFEALFALSYDDAVPDLRADAAPLAVLPILVLLAPLLPFPQWFGRRGAVAVAAGAVALFRLPVMHTGLPVRFVGGAAVLAAGAMFITWAVGYLDRRHLSAGVVLGLVLDQLLRLAGGGHDLSLELAWTPVQALLSLGLMALALGWGRADEPDSEKGLERRAGGLRLRGALALGALLFLDLHVLGVAPVVASGSGTGHTLAGALIGVAGAGALGAVLRARRPAWSRAVALALVALAAGAAILGRLETGATGAVLMAAGHLAVLVLITRALDPASGRRGGVMTTAGFAVFILMAWLYGASVVAAPVLPVLAGAAPWILAAAGLLLGGCFVLLPRPAALDPLVSRGRAVAVTAGLAAAAVGLALLGGEDRSGRGSVGGGAGGGCGVDLAGARSALSPGSALVAATLHISDGRIRSTDAHDLQAP